MSWCTDECRFCCICLLITCHIGLLFAAHNYVKDGRQSFKRKSSKKEAAILERNIGSFFWIGGKCELNLLNVLFAPIVLFCFVLKTRPNFDLMSSCTNICAWFWKNKKWINGIWNFIEKLYMYTRLNVKSIALCSLRAYLIKNNETSHEKKKHRNHTESVWTMNDFMLFLSTSYFSVNWTRKSYDYWVIIR